MAPSTARSTRTELDRAATRLATRIADIEAAIDEQDAIVEAERSSRTPDSNAIDAAVSRRANLEAEAQRLRATQ